METIIPAGYRVTVDSWENDADVHRTIVKKGLDRDMAKFHEELGHITIQPFLQNFPIPFHYQYSIP